MTLTFTNISPSDAVQRLIGLVGPVDSEPHLVSHFRRPIDLIGRLIAKPLVMDRPSPALSVSAMDGYAVRLQEILDKPLTLQGDCRIGEAPISLAEGTAARIYTGSPVPEGADSVLRIEHAVSHQGQLTLAEGIELKLGADIRYQGENAQAGDQILPAGSQLTAASISAAASVGSLCLNRQISVAILNTGNEVLPATSDAIPDWCLRDSNGPALESILVANRWIGSVNRQQVKDDLASLTNHLAEALEQSDAVIMTGGVSKGDHDYVADAVKSVGGEIVFHGLTARPGRPTLGAVRNGKPILGLPGNPLAVLTTGHRIVLPILKKLAGFAEPIQAMPVVELGEPSTRSIDFNWWRPVQLLPDGKASIVRLLGSGDVCGPAASDGFIEVPPNRTDVGPYDYYRWLS